MPIFIGENPGGWLLRAERFFDLHKYIEGERPKAAVIAFEGDALLWYKWESKRKAIYSLVELRGLLLRQFRAMTEGSLHEQWMELRQEGTIAHYHWQFIAHAASSEEVSEICLLNKFLSGL